MQTALYDALDHADAGFDNLIRVGQMPHYVTNLLGIEGDFYIYRNHAYGNMVSQKQALQDGRPLIRNGKDIHFHNLGIETMTEAIMGLEQPLAVISGKMTNGSPAITMMLNTRGRNGVPLYAALNFYSSRPVNGDYTRRPHIVLTVSNTEWKGTEGRKGWMETLQTAARKGTLLDVDAAALKDLFDKKTEKICQ